MKMKPALPPLQLRQAVAADAPALAALCNEIIAIGGSTAYQTPRSVAEIAASYLTGPDCICCHLAEDAAGTVLGFQAIGRHPELPPGWGDIGSYVAPARQGLGVGLRLFAASRASALAAGVSVLNATIRADNPAGLAYYARIGFVDYGMDAGFTLQDGRCVGRVHRRLEL